MTSEAQRSPRVGAVLVSYRPELADLSHALAGIAPQVERFWVVDNGSGPEVVRELAAMLAGTNGELVALPDNLGIAAAHNAGLQAARAAGLDSLVLLDDDSVPAPDMVHELVAAHSALAGRNAKVAAVGARWVDQRSGRAGLFYRIRGGRIRGVAPDSDAPVPVDFLISSGTMLSLAAVDQVGGMRDELFIDHVDTEWCARALAAGWALYGVPRAQLRHALGDSQRRVWLGRWREVAVHSPLRNYYEVRNTLALMRSPHVPGGWRVAQAIRLVQLLGFYGVLVSPRPQRWKAMLLALAHGVRGRWGKLDQS